MTHEAILAQQRAATLERVREESRVLLPQDMTRFDFSQRKAVTGLGPLANEPCWGFLAHSTLAVSEAGIPLGLLEQWVWVREADTLGKRQQRHEKEGYKWVQGLPDGATQAELPAVVVVCDRESHVYDVLDEVMERQQDFIVRAAEDAGWPGSLGEPGGAACAGASDPDPPASS